jgi:hypothetical protein
MKLISEYLERCQQFEQMAAAETNPETKRRMQEQAEAYYKLAVKRARVLSLPLPPRPFTSSPSLERL